MSTFAVGDIQGCYSALRNLLDDIQFDPEKDTLWLTGDLVNRGPESLQTLKFIKGLPNVITVLGNHDLHLLTLAYSKNPPPNEHTMQDILDSPEREELLDWLKQKPFLHYDANKNTALVHAGIPPQWTLNEAIKYAEEAHHAIIRENFKEFFDELYGDEPSEWHENLKGWDRLRYIVNAFTRMRFTTNTGKLLLDVKGKIGTQPPGYEPWFRIPIRKTAQTKIIFGHWAALEGIQENNVYGIDTGCIWGRKLSHLPL